jgi:HlyD family secretion protein/adhesin transport system membrane fusion protein
MSKTDLVPQSGGGAAVATAGRNQAPIKQGSRVARHLAQSVVLEEAGVSGLLRLAMFLIFAAVAVFLGWAYFTEIDEVAVTFGEVVPTGNVKVVQHLEGGIVGEILVKEDEYVNRGDVLVRLDPAQTSAELEQMRKRRVSLALQTERLRAFAFNREFNSEGVDGRYQSLISDQLDILKQQRGSLETRKDVVLTQIATRQAEINTFERQESSLLNQIANVKEELDLREDLLAKGLMSRIIVLDTRREMNRLQGELSRLRGQTAQSREQLTESQTRLLEIEEAARDQALQEMGTVASELSQVEEAVRRLEERFGRLDVRAPVEGYIQGLKTVTEGGVIAPGGIICEIVPDDAGFVVEGRINVRDIGHVNEGQEVTIKVTTFDFARYGGITGELSQISESTFIDEATGEPYYKGIITLDKLYVGKEEAGNKVKPGMTVQADIATGSKSLFSYLLKPVYSSIDSSFEER